MQFAMHCHVHHSSHLHLLHCPTEAQKFQHDHKIMQHVMHCHIAHPIHSHLPLYPKGSGQFLYVHLLLQHEESLHIWETLYCLQSSSLQYLPVQVVQHNKVVMHDDNTFLFSNHHDKFHSI